MNQYVPPIESGSNDSSTGLKTDISPIMAKILKEHENKEYFDPLKKYAQIAEDEGNHIERNPLNNHKLIQNSYFPMSRLVGSFWDKVDKESYFKNRYDKLSFDPLNRESGYSTNLRSNIDFSTMFDKNSEAGQPHPKEDYKQTEYRNTFWRNKGFPFKEGPKPPRLHLRCLVHQAFHPQLLPLLQRHSPPGAMHRQFLTLVPNSLVPVEKRHQLFQPEIVHSRGASNLKIL